MTTTLSQTDKNEHGLRAAYVKSLIKNGNGSPLVSFIVPVYNAQDYLEQCMDSLMEQTMKHIEVICVDDGSTDRSLEILNQYAKKDPRVRVFTQQNKFAGIARNLGLSHARGEYVVFLDSDDFFSLELAEKGYYAAKLNRADVVLWNADRYDNMTGEYLASSWFLRKDLLPKKTVFSYQDCPDHLLQLSNGCPWTKMFRRKFVLETGLQFQGLRNTNDIFFVFSALSMAKRITTVDEILVHYRVAQTTNLQATKKKTPFCFYEAYKAFHNMMKKMGKLDSLRKTYVNAALSGCMYNLQSSNDSETRSLIAARMKDEIFQTLELADTPRSFYYNKKDYMTMRGIQEDTLTFGAAKPEQAHVKISIVIPVYNVEPYLEQCLDSAVNQTLQDIEVICVEDHSPDNCRKILESYAKRYACVKCFYFDESRSALAARKKAVEMAAGEYIMFMDSDDYLASDACERLYSKICQEGVDILHFTTEVLNCANNPESRIKSNQNLLKPYSEMLLGTDVFTKCFVDKKYGFTLWNKIYRAQVVKQAMADIEDRYLPKAQDLYAFFAIAHYAKSYLGWNSDPFYFYCFGRGVTGGKKTTLRTFERYCSQTEIIEVLNNFANKHGLHTNAVQETIQKFDAQFIRECINLWKDSLATEDRSDGFRILCDAWTPERVLEYLTTHFFYQRSSIAKKIGCIQDIPLAQKQIRTVAIYYHHFNIGGVQRVISIQIPALIRMGYRVIMLTDREPSELDFPMPEGAERIMIFPREKSVGSKFVNRIASWNELLEKYQIDLVFYHGWASNMLMWDMTYLKAKRVSVLVQIHSVFSRSLFRLGNEFAELPFINALADRLVTLSKVDQQFWSAFNSNVHYIPNPIDPELRNSQPSSWNNKSLIWLGRPAEEKQPWYAFTIMEKIVQQCPEAKLYFVGDFGEEKWADLAKKKHIQDNVIFCGPTMDVGIYYKQASINLITSQYEGFPMVLVEAQSYSIPTVMFDMPFLELGNKERGTIGVPAGDCKAAAEQIIQLLESEEHWDKYSSLCKESFAELSTFDYEFALKKVIKGTLGDNTLTDTSRKLIHTIINHYGQGLEIQKEKNTPAKPAPANLPAVPQPKTLMGRIWYAVPKIPYKLKCGVKCLQENGMAYTIRKVKEKASRLLFGRK